MTFLYKSSIIWFIILVMGLVSFGSNPLLSDKLIDVLFRIERSRDADEIIYALNIDENGQINKSNPITINWYRNTDYQKIEPLTFIQIQLAYGIKFLEQGKKIENEWRFQFVSYSKRTFVLKQVGYSSYKVFTKIENTEVELNRIYIHFENRSFWFPSISAIELYGKIATSGKLLAEVVFP